MYIFIMEKLDMVLRQEIKLDMNIEENEWVAHAEKKCQNIERKIRSNICSRSG